MNFVGHTNEVNTDYSPEGTVETVALTAVNDNGEFIITEPMPEGFLDRIKWHFSNLRRYKNEQFRNLKPWNEFIDKRKFSYPEKMEIFSRATKNLSYFYSNYVIVCSVIAMGLLFTNIMFLTTMVISAALYYYFRMKTAINDPITILGRVVSPTQAYGTIGAFALCSFYLTGGSSTLFYLGLFTVGTVIGHAVFHEPQQNNQFSFV
eukprot:Tbor_TRINITY_DN5883_c1_g2::TRINITY_DN5883_c1_g2_i1::g.6503::m.6503/K20359/RABAC1, PRAF1; PRA1 family protein 1